MTKGCENLLFLANCLSSNIPPPEYLKKWHIDCLERWQRGESLNEALGVSDSAEERRYRRDVELKKYANMLPGKPWDQAEKIGKEVDKLRQRKREYNEIIKSIDAVFKIPNSTRQIYRILTNQNH